MKECFALRAKIYSYLMDDNSEVKISKGTKKCVIKQELVFENFKDCLSIIKIACLTIIILKSQQRFKSNHHKVYTEEINKISLSSNDDKRLQTDRIGLKLIGLKHIHMEQMLLKYVKVKC